MNDANIIEGMHSGARRRGRARFWKYGLVLGSVLAATGLAHAQSAAPAADDSLTYKGITLYGIVDLGLQYQTHGAPINDYFPGGSADIVQKNSNHSITGITPNNLSQSRIGLNGVEPLFDDWTAVFKLETFFNPQSGEISDALKSLVQNNGRSVASGTQTTNLDSSVAGQFFTQSFVGFSSKTGGTITFGRQNTLLADGISKYDPNAASQAFSVIGLSGTTAGGGDTQDRRLDNSAKYTNSSLFGSFLHLGAMYKFNGVWGSAYTAWEHNLGFEYAGFSLDGYYVKVKDAVAVSALSAAQVTAAQAAGFSSNNALAGTVSDNTSYSFMALYTMAPVKFFAGYEHISYGNPVTPLTVGFDDIGGYKLAVVNNTAFPENKILQVYWAGIKWSYSSTLDLTWAYYGYHQNAYGTGAVAGCNNNTSGLCSGYLEAFSFDAVWKMSKRFDSYAGIMYTGVRNGLANGYIFHTTDLNPTVGLRFKF